MKRAGVLLFLLFVVAAACSEQKPKPLSEPGEKLYPLRGVVVSRTSADNSLRIEHETIPGYMVGMTMDFPVRGADVASLPPNQTKIEATLHVTARSFWVTDVRPR